MKHDRRSVLFAAPYPRGTAGSQRFRYELFSDALQETGIRSEHTSFWDQRGWEVLNQPGHRFAKTMAMIRGFARRSILPLRALRYDVVFIHRELTPVGPPLFEWILCRLLRRRVIYDFDDAIWLPNQSSANPLAARFKWNGKVRSICSWVHRVSAGNEFLADFARAVNDDVVINPTIVDTEDGHNRTKTHLDIERPIIGWTGTHSTLSHLQSIVPVLRRVREMHQFRLLLVSDRKPDMESIDFEFVQWAKATEIDELLKMDIGLMPLPDEDWARGKCGFKAIQYMGVGVPALVSPVGANRDIVRDGTTGYWCDNESDWYDRLIELLQDHGARERLGRNAREHVVAHYSVAANKDRFLKTLGLE